MTSKAKGSRKKLTVKKQTVKDLTTSGKTPRGGRASAGGDGSFCGMNTPTYSPHHTCKCATNPCDY